MEKLLIICGIVYLFLWGFWILAIMSDTKKSGGKMSEKNKFKGVEE